jgi:DNA primase
MKFIIEKTMADKNSASPQGKSQVLDFLAPLAASMTDSIVRQEFVKQLSEHLQISESTVLSRIKPQAANRFGPADNSDDYCGTLEGNFMRLLLAVPTIISEARQFISPETFTDQFSSDLYSMVLGCFDENAHLDKLIDKVNDPEAKRIISLLYAKGAREENAIEELRHTIIRLQTKFLRFQIRQISKRLKFEPSKRTELMEQLKDFTTQLKELETP